MKKSLILLLVVFLSAAGASVASAAGSANNAAQGSANVVQGSAQVGSGAMQGASAVVAVPLKVAGAVGASSDKVGDDLMESAGTKPLPIGEETITAGPAPDQAMEQ